MYSSLSPPRFCTSGCQGSVCSGRDVYFYHQDPGVHFQGREERVQMQMGIHWLQTGDSLQDPVFQWAGELGCREENAVMLFAEQAAQFNRQEV